MTFIIAEQLIIIEGKMFSRLSAGITNAKYYNQAARAVGCMAKVLCIANSYPAKMKSLAFYLIALQSQIEKDLFKRELSKESKINTILIMLLQMTTELRWEGFSGFINFP